MSTLLVLAITFVTYFFIIFTRKIKKSIITFFLASLLFIFKPVEGFTLENLSHIVSFETLGILLGMTIIVEILKESGFFTYFAVKTIKASKYKFWIVLFLLMGIVIIFSAFLDNVVTILFIAPIIFLVADTLEVDPTPLMMLTIVMDNIGGMGTLIGSPVNIIIGTTSGIDFTKFLVTMGPITLLAFVASFFIFKIQNKIDTKSYNKKLEKLKEMDENKAITNKSMAIKGVVIFFIALMGFLTHESTHIPIAVVATSSALVLMLLTNKDFEEMAHEIDWDTLFFYSALFAVSYALSEIGAIDILANLFMPLMNTPMLLMLVFMFVSAMVMPFLNSVPGTLVLAPVVSVLVNKGAPFELWFAFAMGANLGTNLTPLGAVQNFVVVGLLKKDANVDISFSKYMKYGYIHVIVSLIIAVAYLFFHYYVMA
ncbi:citrate transporter [Tepiditoga spiralis]|uniref:Citrate transporter n=1 Tax=Tepiditoga spiralis TaxID=2108365 RepID=A0A7G1G4L0_9BACT|nr:SLC13 family permease [Tepiditoga spiralis]BBE31450.1 citrate transporter [Tepiditoga spiralis]